MSRKRLKMGIKTGKQLKKAIKEMAARA